MYNIKDCFRLLMSMFKGRHEAFFRSKCAQTILEPRSQQIVNFVEGELLKIEESLKVLLLFFLFDGTHKHNSFSFLKQTHILCLSIATFDLFNGGWIKI